MRSVTAFQKAGPPTLFLLGAAFVGLVTGGVACDSDDGGLTTPGPGGVASPTSGGPSAGPTYPNGPGAVAGPTGAAIPTVSTTGGGGTTGTTTPPRGGATAPGTTTPGGSSTPAPSVSAKSCRNLDIVFSIDASGSMKEEQMVMGTQIFPAFAQRLRQISPTLESFRVGVLSACPLPASFNVRGRGGMCNFSGGKRWIESSSPRLTEEFACVGAIDASGDMCTGNNDDEQPASTAAAALEAPAGSGVNAGFLRRDSVLVVVAMTDEDEQPTPDRTPRQIYDRIVALKGDPRLTVFLGIGGSRQCNGPYGGAQQANKLRNVTEQFAQQQRGLFWDLCAGSLDEGLGRAVDLIKRACEEAPPPPPIGGRGGSPGTGGMGGRVIE